MNPTNLWNGKKESEVVHKLSGKIGECNRCLNRPIGLWAHWRDADLDLIRMKCDLRRCGNWLGTWQCRSEIPLVIVVSCCGRSGLRCGD